VRRSITEEQQSDLQEIMCGLASGRPDEAWGRFVDSYGPVLLQVVHLFEKDADSVRDCFVYLCEELAASHYSRLRKFRPADGASFVSWLRAVARNLCIDWERRAHGRRPRSKAIRELSAVEQEVFRLCFIDGMAVSQALYVLAGGYPGLKESDVSAAVETIRSLLTPRQRWVLASRASSRLLSSLDEPGTAGPQRELLSPGPDPEQELLEKEVLDRLAHQFNLLSESEQRLLRLRFGEGHSLKACAEVAGLGNAQRADRAISGILARLREILSI
jgi:RNA polymerase sigma factor (sigma-70 family)